MEMMRISLIFSNLSGLSVFCNIILCLFFFTCADTSILFFPPSPRFGNLALVTENRTEQRTGKRRETENYVAESHERPTEDTIM